MAQQDGRSLFPRRSARGRDRTADTGDLRKDLLTVFDPFAERSYGDDPVGLLAPTFNAAAAHDLQLRAFVADPVLSRQSGAIKAFRRAQTRGELRRGVVVKVTVEMIAGALSDRAYLLGKQIDSAYVRKVIDQAIAGVVIEKRS